GYKCCEGCDIQETDAYGNWGVENGEWCGVLSSCSGSQGYPCCEGCDVVYTDNDGPWGYENEKWCGIKESCTDSTTTKKTTTTTTTTKKTTTTTTKAPAPTQKCRCQYEACGPGICCGAGMSCVETNGYSQCEPDPNAELRPATDCEIGPHFGVSIK
ncbi:Non-catalytic module family DOC2, partial [Piromyces sp. E2]